MLAKLEEELARELDELERSDRLRVLPALAGADRAHPTLGGRGVVSFSSNDYLGLAGHPALTAAANAAALAGGVGASASRLVSGDLPAHRELEAGLAEFLGTPSALLFPSGYQANLGVVTALAGPDDLIASDALNHASLIDGCRLSKATVRVYAHGDAAAARAAIGATDRSYRRRLLITESVFSMDGDVAPLPDLAEIAQDAGALLVVDEAHAVGVMGPAGRGISASQQFVPDVYIGTLGKAFGAAGGFVAGASILRRYLINRARSFIFATALPPVVAAAANAALTLIRSPEGEQRRSRLHAAVTHLRAGLARQRSALGPADHTAATTPPTPITPVILGYDRRALEVSRTLLDAGYFVQAIRPPTVPEGTARLRITSSSAHSTDEVDGLLAALDRVAPR